MKKKLLVLSASAILASNFIFDNSASAVVDVSKNDYESESIKATSNLKKHFTFEQYKSSLEDLIMSQTVNVNAGFEQPEYKEVYKKYQKRFLAEINALNQFELEEKKIKYHNKRNSKVPENTFGLTHERYDKVYKAIKKNKEEFDVEVKKVEYKHPDLIRFDEYQQDQANVKINELENKILMLGQAFYKQTDAREDLYNKLDMIVGKDDYERNEKMPTNKRLLVETIEDLETIIDEFFRDIKLERPRYIPTLTKENENDYYIKRQLRADAHAANENKDLIDPGVKERAKRASEKQAKITKISRESKVKPKKNRIPKQFAYKVLKQSRKEDPNPSNKKVLGMSDDSNHITSENNLAPSSQYGSNGQLIEFTEDTMSNSTGAVKQPPTFTEDPKPTKKEVITESHAVDLDEKTTHYMSGYATGYSVEDTSGYTERDKRAIRRNHVREAEELVNKYVNSHAYQDRVAAQAKVKTLSPEQQKRLNQQIDKIYNGQ
ncbi:coagulase [Staphylococcus hyicus]|uniref:coagulase domain-containing protein n=1 Tax=Staphylococcus hyicus TaxID=1284 RepID=UPI00211BCBDF|nr:coagulase [Staphylococcus hyicus]MCQ9306964.1 coagulase [Staphylococcus hyicus]MCQ9309450.1 coagulase [Staphylococcus hyicus]MCQ9311798.1 coagulase [Staphylococcus hyicus]